MRRPRRKRDELDGMADKSPPPGKRKVLREDVTAATDAPAEPTRLE